MSLYWSVNKNMEIIKNIKEVSDVYFNNDKWDTYDGYCIETDSRKLYRSEEEAKRYLDKDYKDLIIHEEE